MSKPEFTGPELCRYEAHEIVALLKNRDVSPAELLDASLERIAAVEPAINAMPTVCAQRATDAVADLNTTNKNHPGWLGGLPLGIKDLDRVKGVRTTFGTKGLADHVPEFSEHFVDLLEERGGIVVGKTNTPEMGAGGNTFNDVFGMTRNPWDTKLNAGGSSGGAAASLATGETWLSQGSDHGGSLRTPAAYCGVVGLRPSPGRVASSLVAGVSAGFSIDGVQGPMARSARDCALFLDAMSAFDPRSPMAFPPPETSFQDAVIRADDKVRIAYASDLNGLFPVEHEISTHIETALAKAELNGVDVIEACPDLPNLQRCYYVLRGFGLATRALGTPDFVSDHFKQTLRENIDFGKSLTLDDVALANINRTEIYLNMQSFLTNFDVLACPTVGCMQRPVELEWIREINGVHLTNYMDWLGFAFLATTTGLPAISVPIGLSESGLPIGVQLIGPPRGEAILLAVASAIERAVDGPFGPINPNVTHR